MKLAHITLILAVLTLAGCSDNCCSDGSCTISAPAFSAVDVEAFTEEVKEAFDKAEAQVLQPNPEPDTPKGPHPDPDKCICGGTGKIRQGDGHITPCPYHSGDAGAAEKDTPSLIIEDGDITFYSE